MDGIDFYLYDIHMALRDYYDGIQFLFWDELFDYSRYLDRSWTTYCVLQFEDDGPVQYTFGDSATARFKRIDRPCAWVTYPGPRYRFGSVPGTTLTHRYVAFTGPRMQRYIDTGMIATGEVPPIHEIVRPARFRADMQELFQCLGPGLRRVPKVVDPPLAELAEARNLPRAVNLLEGLLLHLHESLASELPQRRAGELDDLVHRINLHPEADWDFREEARRLHVCHGYFLRMFTGRFGVSPGRFVQNARMELAAQKLRLTDMTIAEIAGLIGVEDIYYFSKLFSRYYHIPPGRYRRDVAQKYPNRKRRRGDHVEAEQ
jgi:AraC-like DNA-binding protein